MWALWEPDVEGGRSTRDHWRDVETQPVLIRVRRKARTVTLQMGCVGRKRVCTDGSAEKERTEGPRETLSFAKLYDSRTL